MSVNKGFNFIDFKPDDKIKDKSKLYQTLYDSSNNVWGVKVSEKGTVHNHFLYKKINDSIFILFLASDEIKKSYSGYKGANIYIKKFNRIFYYDFEKTI
ncbi:MAG TPA: hypothetical protein VL947_09345, partial [Cytophagales bacterium]|nr:hypothetical protein [Cytophagales bacterium]